MITLSERKKYILQVIVEEYINSAVPVASSTVIRREGVNVSSATVRNDMMELEEQGYITRPHPSSGSIPLNKGYRYFVESSASKINRLDDRDVTVLCSAISENEEVPLGWLDSTAAALSSLLGLIGFATMPQPPSPIIKRLELVQVGQAMLLLILSLTHSLLLKKLVRLEKPLTINQIESVQNRLNKTLSGLDSVQSRVSCDLLTDSAENLIVGHVVDVLENWESRKQLEWRLQGVRRLFDQPEIISEPSRAREVALLIDKPEVLNDAVKTAREEPTEPASVFIGDELVSNMRNGFSSVMCTYGEDRASYGIIGVIGPIRMQYARAMLLVRLAADEIHQRINQGFVS